MCQGPVIACDIDLEKIRLAYHNAEICGVAHKIDFVVGDIFQMYDKLKANVVFMSPPWVGPGCLIEKCYSLTSMCLEHEGEDLKFLILLKLLRLILHSICRKP